MSNDKYEQLIEDTITLINQKKLEDHVFDTTDYVKLPGNDVRISQETLNELTDLKDDLLEFAARMTKENEELKHKLSLAIEALEKLDTGYNKEIVRKTLDEIRKKHED